MKTPIFSPKVSDLHCVCLQVQGLRVTCFSSSMSGAAACQWCKIVQQMIAAFCHRAVHFHWPISFLSEIPSRLEWKVKSIQVIDPSSEPGFVRLQSPPPLPSQTGLGAVKEMSFLRGSHQEAKPWGMETRLEESFRLQTTEDRGLRVADVWIGVWSMFNYWKELDEQGFPDFQAISYFLLYKELKWLFLQPSLCQ